MFMWPPDSPATRSQTASSSAESADKVAYRIFWCLLKSLLVAFDFLLHSCPPWKLLLCRGWFP